MYMSDEDWKILRKSIKYVKSLRNKKTKVNKNKKQNKSSTLKRVA